MLVIVNSYCSIILSYSYWKKWRSLVSSNHSSWWVFTEVEMSAVCILLPVQEVSLFCQNQKWTWPLLSMIPLDFSLFKFWLICMMQHIKHETHCFIRFPSNNKWVENVKFPLVFMEFKVSLDIRWNTVLKKLTFPKFGDLRSKLLFMVMISFNFPLSTINELENAIWT